MTKRLANTYNLMFSIDLFDQLSFIKEKKKQFCGEKRNFDLIV